MSIIIFTIAVILIVITVIITIINITIIEIEKKGQSPKEHWNYIDTLIYIYVVARYLTVGEHKWLKRKGFDLIITVITIVDISTPTWLQNYSNIAPKWVLDGTKITPRSSQDGPEWIQDGPKSSQNGAKMDQHGILDGTPQSSQPSPPPV